MTHYISQLGDFYVIMGDFNAHTPILSSHCTQTNATGRMLEYLITNEYVCLNNPIDFFTYISASTGKPSCLDICLSSPNLALDIDMKQLAEVGSDHIPLLITLIRTPIFKESTSRKKFKCTKENLKKFSNHISPSTLNHPNDINALADDFTSRLSTVANKFIPKTSGKLKNFSKASWWDDECSIAVNERRRAWKRMTNHPMPLNIENYQVKSHAAKTIIKKKKVSSFRNLISEIKHDTPISSAWKTVKSIKGRVYQTSSPIVYQNEIIVNALSKANTFVENYQNSDKSCVHYDLTDDENKTLNHKLSIKSCDDYNSPIEMHDLETSLSQVKDTSPGEDLITYPMLKSLPTFAIEELLAIYNQSFETGSIPLSWKSSLIYPIRKAHKPKNDVNSYRPIALLSCIGKTLERIVKNRLEYTVEKKGWLKEWQCGFRKKQGTLDVLHRLEHVIKKTLQTPSHTCLVVYIDLKSAFDTVWPTGLVFKLSQLGLRGNLLKWIDNYFKERTSAMFVEGHKSNSVLISNGTCLLYTSPSPRDKRQSRMPSSA